MRIFVGYGYNDRDAWVKDLVFPLIKALGHDWADGQEIYGEQLSDGVRKEIEECQALLGFTTRREPLQKGNLWTTHQWVKDELLTAQQKGIRFVEIREMDVDPQDGILGNIARITYNPAERDRCLLEIIKAISRWRGKEKSYELYLMPESFSQTIRPRLRDANLRCVYRVLEADKLDPEPAKETPIRPITGGLAIRTAPIPSDALIQVEIWNGRAELLWNSDWQPVDSRMVHLREANV
jgi:hypothetical protein